MHACQSLRCHMRARSLLHVATHKHKTTTAIASELSGQGSALFLYYGPYPVVKVVSPVAYELKLPPQLKLHPVIHIDQLV